jgi:hypothetical protein
VPTTIIVTAKKLRIDHMGYTMQTDQQWVACEILMNGSDMERLNFAHQNAARRGGGRMTKPDRRFRIYETSSV